MCRSRPVPCRELLVRARKKIPCAGSGGALCTSWLATHTTPSAGHCVCNLLTTRLVSNLAKKRRGRYLSTTRWPLSKGATCRMYRIFPTKGSRHAGRSFFSFELRLIVKDVEASLPKRSKVPKLPVRRPAHRASYATNGQEQTDHWARLAQSRDGRWRALSITYVPSG